MSDTPRTDQFEEAYLGDSTTHVEDVFEFARELERENAALRHALQTALAIESLNDANLEELIARCRCVMRELAAFNAARKENK